MEKTVLTTARKNAVTASNYARLASKLIDVAHDDEELFYLCQTALTAVGHISKVTAAMNDYIYSYDYTVKVVTKEDCGFVGELTEHTRGFIEESHSLLRIAEDMYDEIVLMRDKKRNMNLDVVVRLLADAIQAVKSLMETFAKYNEDQFEEYCGARADFARSGGVCFGDIPFEMSDETLGSILEQAARNGGVAIVGIGPHGEVIPMDFEDNGDGNTSRVIDGAIFDDFKSRFGGGRGGNSGNGGYLS